MIFDWRRSAFTLCSRKKKRSWMGTVSGTLSHYSHTYFRSGSEDLRESGWWTLALNMEPELTLQQREFVHMLCSVIHPSLHLTCSVAESSVLERALPQTSLK
jgi:hypothetical protein